MKNFIIVLVVLSAWNIKGQEQSPLCAVQTTEGKDINLKDQITKLTVIDLWATWCKPCIQETPYLEEIKKEYGDQIDVIYISLDMKKDKWTRYISKKKTTKKHFWVPQNSPIVAFISDTTEISEGSMTTTWSIPKFFLVDASGKKVDPNCPLPSSGSLQHLIDQNL